MPCDILLVRKTRAGVVLLPGHHIVLSAEEFCAKDENDIFGYYFQSCAVPTGRSTRISNRIRKEVCRGRNFRLIVLHSYEKSNVVCFSKLALNTHPPSPWASRFWGNAIFAPGAKLLVWAWVWVH
jgi:hypothetical protein